MAEQRSRKVGKAVSILLLIGATLLIFLSQAITSAWGGEGWLTPAHHPEGYLFVGAIAVGVELVWLIKTLRSD